MLQKLLGPIALWALLHAPSLVCAQAPAGELAEPPESEEAPYALPRMELASLRERSIEERYVDTLAGAWAVTPLAALLGGGLGAGLMALGACTAPPDPEEGSFLCTVLTIGIGLPVGVGVGWLGGVGLGTTLGAGLDVGDGFLVWLLGLASALGGFAIPAVIGAAAGQTAIGLIAGGVLGPLAQIFLAPLWAVLLYDEAPRRAESVGVAPMLAPSEDGAVVGVAGSF